MGIFQVYAIYNKIDLTEDEIPVAGNSLAKSSVNYRSSFVNSSTRHELLISK